MCYEFTLQKYTRCRNPPNDTIEAAIDSPNIGWCQGEYKAVDHANIFIGAVAYCVKNR